MPTINMTEALQESLAVAPTDVVTYFTFDFTHVAWSDPVRIVYGWETIDALLEADSPSGDGGMVVTFQPLDVVFAPPSTTTDEVPSFEFKFYDASQIVMQKIFDAQNSPSAISMYLRVFLSNRMDTYGPENIPVPAFNVGSVKIDTESSLITGRCVFQDYMGRSAPFRTYTLAEFPGLRRR